MKYNQPHNETDPNAGYKDFNLDTGEPGSIPPAIAIESPQREIVAAITAAGLTPDGNDNTQLSQAIKAEIKTSVQDITAITATSGTVALNANTLYKMTISGETTFTLPSTVNAEKHNQIKILTNLSVVSAINFGTTKYFNCEAPDMSEAGFYDIYIDYDPHQASWVAGVIRKGSAE